MQTNGPTSRQTCRQLGRPENKLTHTVHAYTIMRADKQTENTFWSDGCTQRDSLTRFSTSIFSIQLSHGLTQLICSVGRIPILLRLCGIIKFKFYCIVECNAEQTQNKRRKIAEQTWNISKNFLRGVKTPWCLQHRGVAHVQRYENSVVFATPRSETPRC